MAVPMLADGTIVDATTHWNPLASLANANESGLATEITNRANAINAINTQLGSNIAGGGISDLASWKVTIDNRTTSGTTGNAALGTRMTAAESAITTLNTRTTDASTGNVALGARAATLETRTTDASTGNVALGARVTTLEGSSAAVGPWTACTLTAPYTNRGAGFFALRVRLLPGGNIQLIGNITRGSGTPTNGEQMGVLPSGFRPSMDTHLWCAYNNGTVGMVKIDSSGLLTAFGAGANTIVNFNTSFAGSASGA